MRKPMDVRVHDYTFVLPEPCSEDDIGSLAGNSGQSEQVLHRVGNVSLVRVHDSSRRPQQRLGLVVEEAGGMDKRLELVRIGFGHAGRIGEALE